MAQCMTNENLRQPSIAFFCLKTRILIYLTLQFSKPSPINTSCCAKAPVHQQLHEDDEDTDQHSKAEEDEAPPEDREAVRLPVRLLGPLCALVRPVPVFKGTFNLFLQL